jgi:hypothetical protein
VGERSRKALAVAGSTLLHVAPLVYGMLGFTPKIDIDFELEFTEVELIDPDQIQGTSPPPPVKPAPVPPAPEVKPTPPDPTPTPEPAPKPEPPKPEPEKPQHDLGKKTSEVDQLGPTNSTYFVMLVPKKIRKLSFADKALDIMAPLPDFQYLIAGGGFDALRDFDHIVVASPDLRDWRQTFLAVDYRVSRDEVQRAIERAAAANDEQIEWIEEKGIIRGNPKPIAEGEPDVDGRWFVLLEDKIAVYVREEFLPHILEEEVGDDKTAGNYVANLTKLRTFAARQPTAGMQVVLKDMNRAIKKSKLPFELPDTIELSAEAVEDPELLVRGEFASVVEAKSFEKWWKEAVPAYLDSSLQLKIAKGMIYDPVEIERNDTEIKLRAQFTKKQATLILTLIADSSAKFLKKKPEELAELRAQRKENWLKRKNGKLPPSALDGDAPNDSKTPAPTPTPGSDGGDAGSEPAETPPEPPANPL